MTLTYEAWRITYQSSEQAARAAFERMMELEQGKCLHQIAEPAAVHPDDVAVDALAALMKAKLAKQRGKGYSGWDTDCTQERLSDLLRTHVNKGDPVDVANFCAFLAARGEMICLTDAELINAMETRRAAEPQRLLAVTQPAPQAVQPVAPQLKANCYSDDNGDYWRDCPDDCDFVEGLKVGDTYELQASIRAWSETFRVTKAPDETSDDYEVELVSSNAPAHPAEGVPAQTVIDGGTPGLWRVRKRTNDSGEVLDCFVTAPDCQGRAYDAHILGDDYDNVTLKLADAELIVAAVNAYRATQPAAQGLDADSFAQTMSDWAHGDAEDAARYHWLREQHDKGDDSVTIFIGDEQHGPGHLDAQIDEAIAAQAKKGGA